MRAPAKTAARSTDEHSPGILLQTSTFMCVLYRFLLTHHSCHWCCLAGQILEPDIVWEVVLSEPGLVILNHSGLPVCEVGCCCCYFLPGCLGLPGLVCLLRLSRLLLCRCCCRRCCQSQQGFLLRPGLLTIVLRLCGACPRPWAAPLVLDALRPYSCWAALMIPFSSSVLAGPSSGPNVIKAAPSALSVPEAGPCPASDSLPWSTACSVGDIVVAAIASSGGSELLTSIHCRSDGSKSPLPASSGLSCWLADELPTPSSESTPRFTCSFPCAAGHASVPCPVSPSCTSCAHSTASF